MTFILTAAAAFNLVCNGTLNHEAFQDRGSEPYSRTLRLDLAAKKYCEGECKALLDIVDIQPTKITLHDEKVDTPRERRFVSETIDRETGRHSGLSTSGVGSRILIMNWEGQCQSAVFTGFPDFKTKF